MIDNPSLSPEGPDPSLSGRCAARTKRGPCRAYPVRGAAVCVTHGGGAPQVRRAATRRLLEADLRELFGKIAPAPAPVDNPIAAYAELAGRVQAWMLLCDSLLDGLASVEVTTAAQGEQTRVIVQSDKQKDDEEADDVIFAVEIVKLDGEAKEDGSPVTSVVLVPAEAVHAEPAQSKRPPATRKILEALEVADAPLTASRIVDWIAEKYGHGLTRETVSKALNGLAAEGVADRIEETKGTPVIWLLARRSEGV